MARYIDADALREKISEIKGKMDFYTGTACFLAVLESPTADVEEVRHGEWIEKFKEGFWYYDCPFCDDGYVLMERDENKPNYCGNCGAKMDGGKANDL